MAVEMLCFVTDREC